MHIYVYTQVKAEEDLYLTGAENTIRRVTAETNYSCLMLKSQRFSSLFRHYAKYHGLRKDDLEYYFVNLLENEDTPESVQLQRGDTIMVRKKRRPEPPIAASDDDEFFKDMKELLDDEEHMDAIFHISPDADGEEDSPKIGISTCSTTPTTTTTSNYHPTTTTTTAIGTSLDAVTAPTATAASVAGGEGGDLKIPAVPFSVPSSSASSSSSPSPIIIKAHKSILTARAEYFKALFRSGTTMPGSSQLLAFKESQECIVKVENCFNSFHIRCCLEFIYTNRISGLRTIGTDNLLRLLHLSDRWLLRDLKRLIEIELIRDHMRVDTVARMYGATEEFTAQRLQSACIEFIMTNLRQLAGNQDFEEEMKNYPHLCMPVLKAAADLIPEPAPKKQRTDHHHHSSSSHHNNNTSAAAAAAAGAPGTGGAQQHHHHSGTPSSAVGSSPVPDSDT